jgi:hypothetical protein
VHAVFHGARRKKSLISAKFLPPNTGLIHSTQKNMRILALLGEGFQVTVFKRKILEIFTPFTAIAFAG